MNAEKMDSRHRPLHLIYKGNTSGILADRSLRESLNDLMKYELITISNQKLSLTERGKIALKNGINSVIVKVRPKSESENPIDQDSTRLTILIITILLMLLAILLFMIF